MFQRILDELSGARVKIRPNGEVLFHWGDLEDPEDPRWQVISREAADDLAEELNHVLSQA